MMEESRFSGHQENARKFVARVAPLLKPGMRLLDIGCGTGDIALEIMAIDRNVGMTGVDFSSFNVDIARKRVGCADTVDFVCADYMTWNGGPFDVIVADSVLHLIAATPEALAAKLAGDLRSGGVLVATVPERTARNLSLMALRRLWRMMPKAADRLAYGIGRVLHPGFSAAELHERVPYMRLLPNLFGREVLAAFEGAGLVLSVKEPWPGQSFAKPGHSLLTWRHQT